MTPEPACDGIPFGVHSNPYGEPAKVVNIESARAPATYPLTELGAAESFTADCGDVLRFDHRRGRWLIFDRQRWQPDSCNSIIRIGVEHVRRQQHLALAVNDVHARGRAVQHWMKFDRRSMLDTMLTLSKSLLPIADAGDQWDLAPLLMGCNNGIVDLRAGTLRDGQPDDRITKSTGLDFDPDATCPRWASFVTEVLPDADVAAFVWKALGYSLTGDMRQQCFFLPYGKGSNGKSTLMDLVCHCLGDYALTTGFSTFEQAQPGANTADLASLDGARFVNANEGSGRWLNSGRLKDLTGGEKVSARHLYQDPFTFRPVCKIWLSTNELPRVSDTSHGLWRRLKEIPFLQRFEGATDNTSLKDELLAEAPGILTWLVGGCLAWQSDGLATPAAVAAATADYRSDADPIGRFVDEACDLAEGSEVRASDLYAHYRNWATTAGLTKHETLTANMFGRKVADRFTRDKRRGGFAYLGVARASVVDYPQ